MTEETKTEEPAPETPKEPCKECEGKDKVIENLRNANNAVQKQIEKLHQENVQANIKYNALISDAQEERDVGFSRRMTVRESQHALQVYANEQEQKLEALNNSIEKITADRDNLRETIKTKLEPDPEKDKDK